MTPHETGQSPMSEREEVELLLPWYHMGTLDDADRARVERYLEAHPDMRAQIALIEDERLANAALNDRIDVPSALTVDRLLADAKPSLSKRASAASQSIWQQLGSLLTAPTAGAVRLAAVAACAVIVAQAVAIGVMSGGPASEGGGYEVASGAEGTAVPAGTDALVRLKDDATAASVLSELRTLDLRVVDGPDSNGFVTVRIGNADMSDADIEKRIDE
ncbi:MAG: hypothetical protein AAFO62_08170, partial [Pseudomonadota bacterium]